MIADDLTTKIRDGELPPGAALPPQRELSASYGVTLATLRQALQQLENDGLLLQQAGRGTFVTEPRPTYELHSMRGFEEDLREQGQTVATYVLEQKVTDPPGWAEALLGDGSPVVQLERLRLLAGRPVVHQLSYVRELELAEADFSERSLYAVLASRGVTVFKASEVIRPGVLDDQTAELLRQPPGTPVFLSERITYDPDMVAVVLDRATILGTAMEIRTDRALTGVSVQWTRPPT
ncbi:GntR family transcriptional regulator [Paractinoplanes atraurantiacus]|uniref:GntR family transcriptional regulator n=1 Tax=Paractinoplanes atraurantiacus TaxID=1036182 RepID=A0A285IQC8_9ACTN|nr:GntR family transcriptional regulator [Actinoplanes atraurantiacus]SNY49161.1 GntR family transcriptional regulator [Actinoplanes atraurantiacus]